MTRKDPQAPRGFLRAWGTAACGVPQCPLSHGFLGEKSRQAETESRRLGQCGRHAVAASPASVRCPGRGPGGSRAVTDGRCRPRARRGGGDGGAHAAHEPKPDPLLDDSRPSPFWEKRTTRDGAQAAEDRDAEASTIVVKQGRGGGDAWNFRNLGALLARPQVSQPHPTAGVY